MWADMGGGIQMMGEGTPRKDIWTWGTESTIGGPGRSTAFEVLYVS